MNNIESSIVLKFGGSSMSDANSIKRVGDIVRFDPAQRFVVVSAPGKSMEHPQKITDLLYQAHDNVVAGIEFTENLALRTVMDRFISIGEDLGVRRTLRWVDEVISGISMSNSRDWCASRGEWLTAQIFADYLDAEFVDADEVIRVGAGGQIDPLSYTLVRDRLRTIPGLSVIPGFYGRGRSQEVETFARGGSDLTGAIIARSVDAIVYQNWTDVNGILSADPRKVVRSRTIESITYEEVRELGIRGAQVLQRDTILPLVEAGIPINLRNTFNPDHPGTMITTDRQVSVNEDVIGIVGDGPFVSFNVQRYGMNNEIGIGRRILEIFQTLEISYEQSPSGKDYMTVIVNQDQLDGSESMIRSWLEREVKADKVWIEENLGLLAVVGLGIRNHRTRVTKRLASALDDVSIPVKAIDSGTSGISMVVAVDYNRLDEAVKLLHEYFME